MDKFDTPQYKRSRAAYITQCTTEYFIGLLIADAYLATLLSSMGIDDALVGIISSFVSLAFVFQLATILLVRVRLSTKTLVTFFETVSAVFFLFMYLIPFLPIGKMGKTVLAMVSILLAYLAKYLVQSLLFKWGSSFVDPGKRARFSATKEIISLFLGMFYTAGIGYAVDHFEAAGNQSGAFLFIAGAILVLTVLNFISLYLMQREDASEHAGDRMPLSVVLKNTLGHKPFRNVVILTVLYDVARYFTVGFMGIYKTKDLMLSVFVVQLINIAGNFARMALSRPIGKYSDKTSFANGYCLGLLLLAGAFFINIFTTRTTWFFVIVYTILFNCSSAGTNQNSFNIVYSYVDQKYITQAMSLQRCIGGLCGFGASLLGGKILSLIQANGNRIGSLAVNAQQLLSVISFALTVTAIVFLRKTIAKQPILKQ